MYVTFPGVSVTMIYVVCEHYVCMCSLEIRISDPGAWGDIQCTEYSETVNSFVQTGRRSKTSPKQTLRGVGLLISGTAA